MRWKELRRWTGEGRKEKAAKGRGWREKNKEERRMVPGNGGKEGEDTKGKGGKNIQRKGREGS